MYIDGLIVVHTFHGKPKSGFGSPTTKQCALVKTEQVSIFSYFFLVVKVNQINTEKSPEISLLALWIWSVCLFKLQ